MQLDDIQAIFFQECDEGLATIESALAAVRAGGADPETINTIFRAVHSIKGGAGAFGFEPLQAFSHRLETVLDMVRTDEIEVDPDLIHLLFAGFDTLSDHVASAQSGTPAPRDTDIVARLAAIEQGGTTAVAEPVTAIAAAPCTVATADFDLDDLLASIPAAAVAAPWRVTFRPGLGAFNNGSEPLLVLREIEALGGSIVGIDLDDLPPLDALNVGECHLAWTMTLPPSVRRDEIEAVFEFLTDACEVSITEDQANDTTGIEAEARPDATADIAATDEPSDPSPSPIALESEAAPALAASAPTATADGAGGSGSATIRVELEKLDRLVNLVGELVITQAMLAQRLSHDGGRAVEELSDLDALTRELQDSAMSIRAQPVKSVFSRVPRIIRELEAATGKSVRLQVEGEMTEVDKTVVERIGEPLTHMIRNAVDHGLESTEERVAAGKPSEGVVRLAAEHRSGRIVITVSDDGRGIDLARVRAKAVERGIIAADANLSDDEIENLIFAPGFSTAATVSNISGRGVGMDVVRRNVQALGGRIGISSTFGKGSTFTLTLPLTLAILDGMVVSVGSQTYVIPLGQIVESLRPQAEDVRSLGRDAELLNVRGTYLPILPIGRVLGIDEACCDPTKAVLVVVETDTGQAILMVDGIQDQRQVVVKSLEANYAPVAGLAGATVLGDGRVALILDVETLVQRHRAGSLQAIAA